MKKMLSALLFLLMPMLHAADVKVAAAESKFTVSLPANPTTGYQWSLSQYKHKLIKLVSNQYIPPESHLMGAGGTSVFTFSLVQGAPRPKSTVITFRYARPWESKSGTVKRVIVTFLLPSPLRA